ncbi:hypothetical protein, partial [Microbacterium sp. W4I20]|uniref:hypothetical protein n=1 Tax=Microbacterium sp. W4I20 TaxID=3042262 RepID=UPI0027850C4C
MTPDLHWPGDSDTVIRWIRAGLQPTDAELVRGLENVSISADVSGATLELLSIDASGVELTLHSPNNPAIANAPPAAAPEIVQRRPGVLRSARLIADPIRIDSIAISVDAQIHDVPVEWLVYAEPTLPDQPETIHGIDLADDGAGMRGAFTASLRADDLSPLIASLARPLLHSNGIHLNRLKATVTQDGADGIRIDAGAGIRWRLLGASARGTARVHVSPNGVISLRDLKVGSRNPVVMLALRAVRQSVQEQIGKSFDLNEDLLPAGGPRLTDL